MSMIDATRVLLFQVDAEKWAEANGLAVEEAEADFRTYLANHDNEGYGLGYVMSALTDANGTVTVTVPIGEARR